MGKVFDVVIEQDAKTKQFYASVPALPGCYSHADSLEELMDNIKEAIEIHEECLKVEQCGSKSARTSATPSSC